MYDINTHTLEFNSEKSCSQWRYILQVLNAVKSRQAPANLGIEKSKSLTAMRYSLNTRRKNKNSEEKVNSLLERNMIMMVVR